MFSTQGPVPSTPLPSTSLAGTPQAPSAPSRRVGTRPLLASALKGAGLLDRDAKMRDAPGASTTTKKGITIGKIKSHRPKAIEAFKAQSVRHNPLATRIGAASKSDPSRATPPGSRPLLPKGRKPRMVDVSDAAVAPGASRVIELWRQFVQQRYNPASQFLNLENMAGDEFLKGNKLLAPGEPGTSEREASVIFKLASKLEPPVVTISLANNRFNNAKCLVGLSHYLPKLANLSLENNNLRMWHDLDFVSPRKGKLQNLRELIMNGNPLRENLYRENQADVYRSEVLKRFPLLEMLDHGVVTKIGFDVPLATSTSSHTPSAAPTSFPVPMCPNGIPQEIGGVVSEFLVKFFTQFDASRHSLHPAYTPTSTFSFSANTPSPPRARLQGLQPHTGVNPWEKWIELGSRNLNVVGSKLGKSIESLYTGSQNIVTFFGKMPATKHSILEAEKFVVDAWTVPNVLPGDVNGGVVLFISVHGEFTEGLTQRLWSFDRSFILAPSAPESLAKREGWPAVILSDQLVIRAYSRPDAWKPGPLKTQAEAATPIASSAPVAQTPLPRSDPALMAIQEPQRSLVAALSARTRLNTAFSIQCLEGNAWDMQRAVANFEELKGSIPPEAFI